jgi:hypothetical protein
VTARTAAVRSNTDAGDGSSLRIDPGDDTWRVAQSILVGDDVSEFTFSGRIDLARSRAQRRPVLLLDHVGAV